MCVFLQFLQGLEFVNIDTFFKISPISNIRNEIRELNCNPKILQSVMNNVLERAQICEAENGQHLKDIIFHKYCLNFAFFFFKFPNVLVRSCLNYRKISSKIKNLFEFKTLQ